MSTHDVRGATSTVPSWLQAAAERSRDLGPAWLGAPPPPVPPSVREAAVLLLFGPLGSGRSNRPNRLDAAEIILTERAHDLRHHPGQVSFPGGGREPGDADLTATALREAREEIGVDPASVDVLATLPALYVPVSEFTVTPVLGWWREPGPIGVADPAEVERVVRARMSDVIDPANRFRVRHPRGWIGPAFDVDDALVWGFTAGILSAVLDLAEITKDWDHEDVRRLP